MQKLKYIAVGNQHGQSWAMIVTGTGGLMWRSCRRTTCTISRGGVESTVETEGTEKFVSMFNVDPTPPREPRHFFFSSLTAMMFSSFLSIFSTEDGEAHDSFIDLSDASKVLNFFTR